MPVLKNAKHERFAQELTNGKTADEAYVLAGYKENRGNAATLKANQSISDRVEELLTKAADRVEITKSKVLEELAKIGFSNMQDYMRASPDGDPVLDFSKLTREQAAALCEVTVEDFKDGRGEDARDVRRIKFKLSDKRAALVDIGKHLGMFVDRTEHTGKDGKPIQTEDVTARGREKLTNLLDSISAREQEGEGNSRLN